MSIDNNNAVDNDEDFLLLAPSVAGWGGDKKGWAGGVLNIRTRSRGEGTFLYIAAHFSKDIFCLWLIWSGFFCLGDPLIIDWSEWWRSLAAKVIGEHWPISLKPIEPSRNVKWAKSGSSWENPNLLPLWGNSQRTKKTAKQTLKNCLFPVFFWKLHNSFFVV